MIADTAYDNFWVYDALIKSKIMPIILPRSPPVLSKKYCNNPTSRDILLLDRHKFGIQKWQRLFGYTKCSLIETAISRYKKNIGSDLFARKDANRITDVKLGCDILNKMIDLGMPKSYKLQKCA